MVASHLESVVSWLEPNPKVSIGHVDELDLALSLDRADREASHVIDFIVSRAVIVLGLDLHGLGCGGGWVGPADYSEDEVLCRLHVAAEGTADREGWISPCECHRVVITATSTSHTKARRIT